MNISRPLQCILEWLWCHHHTTHRAIEIKWQEEVYRTSSFAHLIWWAVKKGDQQQQEQQKKNWVNKTEYIKEQPAMLQQQTDSKSICCLLFSPCIFNIHLGFFSSVCDCCLCLSFLPFFMYKILQWRYQAARGLTVCIKFYDYYCCICLYSHIALELEYVLVICKWGTFRLEQIRLSQNIFGVYVVCAHSTRSYRMPSHRWNKCR